MGRPKIVEVDYYDFAAALRKAIDTGKRIEKLDQPDQWADYVKDHKVNEVAMMSWGKAKFPNAKKPNPVIIKQGSSWDGFYVYSHDDEAALKWVLEED